MSFLLLIQVGICSSILNLIILEFVKEIENKDNQKQTKGTKGTYFIIYCLMEITIFQFINNNINIFLIVPCYLILILLFEYCRKTVNIKKTCMNSFIVNLVLLAVITLVKVIVQSKISDEYLMIFYAIFYMIIWKVVDGLLHISLKMLTLKEWIIIVLSVGVSACIIAISAIVMNSMQENELVIYMQLVIVAVIVIDLILIYLIFQVNQKYVNEKELLQFQQQSDMQKQYMDNVKQMDEQVRKIRHDMSNQLNVVNTFLEENNYDKAREYLKKYVGRAIAKERFVNTDNDIVNAVINSKILYCKNNGIKIHTTVQKSIQKIDDIDICSLLGNLLDNAIEAELKLDQDDRYIVLEILTDDATMSIFLKNRIGAPVLENNTDMETTKSDFKNHGFGTKIISKIVKKYNGFLDYSEEEDFFCCNIRL